VRTILAVGTSGPHTHLAAEISDSTVAGRAVLTAATTLSASAAVGLSQKRRVRYVDHFFSALTGTAIAWTSIGTAAAQAPASSTEIGLLRVSVGTSTTAGARSGISGTNTSMRVGTVRIGMGFRVAPAITRADGTNLTSIRLGLYSAGGAGDPTTGTYLRSVNGGNWFLVCRNGGVETAVDTGVALAALGVFQELYLECNAAGTQVRAFIGQALVATITTNVPASATSMIPYVSIQRDQAAATNTAMDLDWVALGLEYAADLLPWMED
jgi:hypothetical protein